MGPELLQLLGANWAQIRGKRHAGRSDPKLPELTRVAGGYRAWSERHGGEWPALGAEEGTQLPVAEDLNQAGVGAGGEQDVWQAVLDPSTNVIQYRHVQSGRVTKVRPPGAQVLVERLGHGPAAVGGQRRATAPVPALFEESESEEDEEDRCAREQREVQAAQEQKEREHQQTDCDVCGGALLDPLRLVACRCAMCACCAESTVQYVRQCPACGQAVTMAKDGPKSDSAELRRRIAEREADPTDPLYEALKAQRAKLAGLTKRRNAACRVVLEFGNTASGSGGKTSYTTFVKTPVVERGPKGAQNAVAKVDFNINPGYKKPTATVTDFSLKTGAKFEYTMARSYPCFITVHFKKEWGLPQVVGVVSALTLPLGLCMSGRGMDWDPCTTARRVEGVRQENWRALWIGCEVGTGHERCQKT